MTPFGSKEAISHFIFPIIAAIAIALLVDQLFEYFVLPLRTDISNSYKVERLVMETHENEIPIFGSSKGRSSFIPDSLHPDVFNYSMEKCNFDVIAFFLEVELQKDKHTPIIIEFNARSFVHNPSHTIDLSTFIPMHGSEEVVDYLAENDRLDKYQLLPGVRYYGSYVGFLRSVSRKVTSKKITNRGGIFMDYYPGDKLLRRFTDSRYKMIEKRAQLEAKEESGVPLTYMEVQILDQLQLGSDFGDDKERLAVFEKMVKDHPEREFIMVFTPHHPSELAGIRNLNRIDSLFNYWNENFENLHALDYSRFELPDSCFKNSSHINLEGARRFCSVLSDDIHYLLYDGN